MERKTLDQFKDELARATLRSFYSGSSPRHYKAYLDFEHNSSKLQITRLKCSALVLFHKQEMSAKNEEIENKTLLLEAAKREIERLNETISKNINPF